jgi:hypothetical protein
VVLQITAVLVLQILETAETAELALEVVLALTVVLVVLELSFLDTQLLLHLLLEQVLRAAPLLFRVKK